MTRRARRARAVMAALAFAVAVAVVGGVLFRLGPFAADPARAITDPEEILAGALQAVLDASTVRVSAELEGTLPAQVAGTDDPLVLDGATVDAAVDIAAVRTRVVAAIPALDPAALELRSSWDTTWVRAGDGAWAAVPVSAVLDVEGLDLNPLTMVDRLRTYLDEHPATRVSRGRDLPCADGVCRVVTYRGDDDALVLIAGVLPEGRREAVPPADVVITLQADVDTLRPVVAFVEVVGRDGARILDAAVRFRDWDEPVEFEEPSPSPSGGGTAGIATIPAATAGGGAGT